MSLLELRVPAACLDGSGGSSAFITDGEVISAVLQ